MFFFLHPWHFSNSSLMGQQQKSGYTKIIASFSLQVLFPSFLVTKCFKEKQKGRTKEGRQSTQQSESQRIRNFSHNLFSKYP
jgi:hypothetical protein